MTQFPGNKDFAFTIFDDTDLSTVANVQPAYRLLDELGFRTTKSVWPLASDPNGRYTGQSLQDADYLAFVRGLQQRGFEIALHNVRNTSAMHEEIQHGLEECRRLMGTGPRIHANHSTNADNIYWGPSRFSLLKPAYRLATAFRSDRRFEGEDPDSRHFWGDVCREQIRYVRNLVFRDINLARINPSMPYHDPAKPWVNAWFSSSDGADVNAFCELISEPNQDRLEQEGGVCIVYTHLACGFVERGLVVQRVAELLRRMSRKNGWFVPAGTLLDFLRGKRGTLEISRRELWSMELKWVVDQMARKLSRRHARMSSQSYRPEPKRVAA